MDDILDNPHLLANELTTRPRFTIPINSFHIEAQRPKPTVDADEDDDEWDVEPRLIPKPEPEPKKSDDGEFGELESEWEDTEPRTKKPKKKKPLKRARKRMPNGARRPRAAVRLPQSTIDKIDKLAFRRNKKRSDIMRELIRESLRRVELD